MPETTWTIGRLLTWTTDFLRAKGVDSPRLDAEVLLAHARGCARIELYTAYEEVASYSLRETFRTLVGKRAAGTPVGYLVGHREFFSLSFQVSPAVLVPRPETELLVVKLLDLAKEIHLNEPCRIADVGTGSGAIAVCCAKHLPHCQVTAIDISEKALAVAQGNAALHGVADHIDFVQGDLLASCPVGNKFHIIASNPPYITTEEMGQLPPDVALFEPHLALDGGEQGTNVIERLLPQAADRLVAGGWLLVEISPTISERVPQMVSAMPALVLHETEKDLCGHPRILQGQRQP